MAFAFAGVIGRGGDGRDPHDPLQVFRRELGGVGSAISEPFQGFVHCVSLSRGFEASEADLAAMLHASRRFPEQTFAWIEVECFGGVCSQRGLQFGDGGILHIEPQAMDSAHDSVLMRLMARIGAPIASPIFPPFARGVFNFDDAAWMSRALALARRQLGRVAPNPAVGCVLVHGRDTFAEAATGDGGRPHAEEAALDEAGAAAKGATAYVTLEPCSARSAGGTSCTQRLIEARVARVVIACREPNPASACGAEVLRQAGVAVTDSVLEGEAEHLNRGFFKRLRTGRPWTVVQDEGDGQDVECALHPGETPDAMLDRLGSSGQTRVFARPGSAEAAALAMAGLVDQYGADED